MPRPSLRAKLLALLRSEGLPLPEGAEFRCLRPARWQLNDGAWIWHVTDADGWPLRIGTQWPIRELLAAPSIILSKDRWGDTQIDPGAERILTDDSSQQPE